MMLVMCMPSVLWRCWLGGTKGIRLVKTEWWGAGMVVCLEWGADLHMAQLMPLPLTVSCFSKIQILVPAHPGSPDQRAVKQVCVCVCVGDVRVLRLWVLWRTSSRCWHSRRSPPSATSSSGRRRSSSSLTCTPAAAWLPAWTRPLATTQGRDSASRWRTITSPRRWRRSQWATASVGAAAPQRADRSHRWRRALYSRSWETLPSRTSAGRSTASECCF